MKILSIDVGIKNLAFCLFSKSIEQEEHHFHIEKWDSINLSQQNEMKCLEIEKNQPCNKAAKFTKNGKCYCLKHSKKQEYQIPTSELKSGFINKQKIQSLYEMADKYKIKYEKPIKKNELVSLINDYIYNTCFESIENTNASKIDLVTIGRNLQSKFDTILDEHLSTIDKVIIENQISPIANRMKTIQGMIAQYFIMKNNNISIEFVSSINKLKDSSTESNSNKNEGKEDKLKYGDRKKIGIKKCLEILTNEHNYKTWEDFFSKHTKKDDLADSFLQGIWYIKNKL
jgi:hypothetical protein